MKILVLFNKILKENFGAIQWQFEWKFDW